jgi:hypothetical protein
MCDYCNHTGWITETHLMVYDGAYLPHYVEVRCNCNPEPTDDDAPHWASDEPRGTAYDDFHPLGY